MADLFQRSMTHGRRPRRTWDEGLGGMKEAEAREAKAQESSDKAERAGQKGLGREDRDRTPSDRKPSNVRGILGKVARLGASYLTGGMSEVAIKGVQAAKGFMERRGVTGASGTRASRESVDRSNTRDRDGGGRDRQIVRKAPAVKKAAPAAPSTAQIAPTYIAYKTPEQPAYVQPSYQETVYEQPIYPEQVYGQTFYQEPIYSQPLYSYSYGNRAWDEEELEGVPSIVMRSRRGAYPRAERSWDDAELEGLSKTLKKIGKKLKSAIKPKNLLKTAAVAAVAYGGYKLATSGKLTGVGQGLANLGKGLVKAAPKIGSAVMQVAPQVASSLIAYKTATAAQPSTFEDYTEENPIMPREFLLDPQGYAPQTSAYAPEIYAQATRQVGSSLPSWVIPAAISAGVLLIVTSKR